MYGSRGTPPKQINDMDRRGIIHALALHTLEFDRGITIIDSESSLEQAKQNILAKSEALLIKNYRSDDFIYNPNASTKRGSKFTPKKKKRKKR